MQWLQIVLDRSLSGQLRDKILLFLSQFTLEHLLEFVKILLHDNGGVFGRIEAAAHLQLLGGRRSSRRVVGVVV